jgi:hypothetical protein
MNCQEATTQFSDLHDGRMSGVERTELEAHLAVCLDCGQEWGRFRETIETLHGLGAVEPRPGFAGRVREQIERPPWFRRLTRWLFIPWKAKLPLEAAALVLLAVGIVVIYKRLPEMRQVVERPGPQQPLVSLEPGRRDELPEAPPSVKDTSRAEPMRRLAPLAGGVRTGPAGEEARRARLERDASVTQSPPPAGAVADGRATLQAPSPPSQSEVQPAPPSASEESARLLSAPAPSQAPQPFRIMTLRTPDVAVAEERIREWVQQAGGRLLDPVPAWQPTGPGQRAFSVAIPIQAVPRFDALLAELGQLFGKELEVSPSREALIHLTISPKTRIPAKIE